MEYRLHRWKTLCIGFLILISLVSCGPASAPTPQATAAPQVLPATWTPTLAFTVIPTFTNIATFTPVPPIALPGTPTNDSLGALSERFPDSLTSPVGQWVAVREPTKLLVKSLESNRVWTLPCELFDECSTVYPVRWSDDGRILYFAPAPTVSGAPSGISLVTALAMIEVKSGKWSIVLPDSERHYDFTFSPKEDYIAYTQSSGEQAEDPSVTLGIYRLKNNKVQQEHTLDEMWAGDIVWSPFKTPRIVFQVRNTETGSSVVFYDLETNVLKYVLRGEQADLDLSVWNDADNTVTLEERDWLTYSRSYWFLNPFNGEMSSARVTATPRDDVTVTPTITSTP
jgi:hypothetical protein